MAIADKVDLSQSDGLPTSDSSSDSSSSSSSSSESCSESESANESDDKQSRKRLGLLASTSKCLNLIGHFEITRVMLQCL